MTLPDPPNPNFAARVYASFARQQAMATIGARLILVEPGRAEIELPYREDLTQQHGYLHGGIVGMIADNAAGYAAFTLMPANASILTVEYKLNLLAPAAGDRFVAKAQVVRAGRTLVIAEACVFAEGGGAEVEIARCLGTLMTLAGRPDTPSNSCTGSR